MRIRSIAPAIGLAMLGLTVTAMSASAADYPVLRGSQIEDTPPPPDYFSGPFNWSGFYVGGGAGVSNTEFEPGSGLQDLARFAFRNTLLGAETDMGGFVNNLPSKRDSGATYFGFAGYNIAFGDAVVGFELDYTRSGHSYSINDYIGRRTTTSNGTLNDWSMTTNQAAELQDYGTARLRFGWAVGRFMPFGTFGAAVGRFNTASTIKPDWFFSRIDPFSGGVDSGYAAGYAPGDPAVGNIKRNVYGFGITAGLGFDWALTDNLFLRGEYQLIRFADVEGTVATINTARVAAGLKF